MTNIKVYKSRRRLFSLSLAISEIKHFKILTLKSESRSQSTIFAMTPFDGKYQNLQKSLDAHFGDIVSNFLLSKRSRSQSTILQWLRSMANMKSTKVVWCVSVLAQFQFNVSLFDLRSWSMLCRYGVQFSQWRHLIANIKI